MVEDNKIFDMKRINLYFAILTVLFLACQEMEHAPLENITSVPPTPVVTEVTNFAGGARINFSIPDDPSILYVSAIFEPRKGERREVKSSIYKNYVEIEGFGDTEEYTIQLYAINKGEIRSEPTECRVNPLTPPITETFETLEVKEDFGGVNTRFLNDKQKNLVFYTLYKDEEGTWVNYDRLFTAAKSRDYSVRGLLPEPTEFGFYFRDEWGNLSDTLVKNITPLYEEMLDKKLFKAYPLPSDTYEWQANWGPVSNLWDGDYANHDNLFYQATTGAKVPNWITIDLGQQAKLSRLVVFQSAASRPSYAYNYGTPRNYEIWGSNSPTDDWDSWTLLMECESIKPSGSPVGQRTKEDEAYALEGENYNFPLDAVPYRYIRFKMLRSWTGAANLMLAQLDFYGQPDN
jgi:hypothetical protein